MAASTGPNPLFLGPGLMFLSLGAVIWMMPDFFRFLVAAFFCALGAALLYMAFRPPGPRGGIRIQGFGPPFDRS